MKELYKQSIEDISKYFYQIESKLNAPEKVIFNTSYVYRYSEETVFEAMLLKLARVVTSLKSIYLLNQAGYLQEQASLQRINDELTEDIQFLSYSVIFDNFTNKHKQYLDSFFQEEISELKKGSKFKSTVPRKKIRAFIHSVIDGNHSSGIHASKDLSNLYSGYVHAAAPQIMELYYGAPPQFHLSGLKQSPVFKDHEEDLLNYFYRSILSFVFVAKAFGDEDLYEEIHVYSKGFASKSNQANKLTPYV